MYSYVLWDTRARSSHDLSYLALYVWGHFPGGTENIAMMFYLVKTHFVPHLALMLWVFSLLGGTAYAKNFFSS